MKKRTSITAFLLGILILAMCFAFTAAASEAEQGEETQQPQEISQPQETQPVSGWQTTKSGKTYYLKENGEKAVGHTKIGSRWYLFSSKGYLKTGWRKVGKKRYYFDPDKGGARARGWTKIGKDSYYFKAGGSYKTGWLKKKGKYYYFRSNGVMVKGWKTISGKRYYFLKGTGERASGVVTISKKKYLFSKKGTLVCQGFGPGGIYADASGHALEKSTIKKLLLTALEPVGSTMYIWGGGWNAADNGADITARTIGVSPQWKKFFDQQSGSYNYRNYRYQIKNGLDCSGYVGWVIYNTFNTTSGNSGYVMLAQQMASRFSGYGWGSYKPASAVTDFKAGDIMSLASGHVYIVVGQCSDGSVVLLHSSPCGVMISGTTTRSGSTGSEAISLANKYMKTYYPQWYAKFPNCTRGASYITQYSQMRWYIGTKKSMLSDPDGYRSKSAKQILKNLFKSMD